MSNLEHYIENLIDNGQDCPGEPNKKALSAEQVEAIDTFYWYLTNKVFFDRDCFEMAIKKGVRGW